MNAKLYFQIIFFLLTFSKSFSQITLTLDEIYLNNQTSIQNCNTVDFGTTNNNYLIFYYTLEKNINQAVTDGTIQIKLKYNSPSSGSIKNSVLVASSLWNLTDQYSNSIPTNILASEIQVSGSSILLEFIEGGYTYKSCEYPLTKTPTPEFQLLPSSVSISCGSTSTTNFSVWNVHSSPGTVTYNWNVGTGWSLPDGTPVSGTLTDTSSSIQLKPSSGSILPSNVSMTATLNGVQYYDSAIVDRSPISETITDIIGPSTFCSGSTNYTFGSDSVLPGQTVNWSLSSSTVATLSNSSNTGVTLTKIGNGSVTLTASISNGCGQSYSVTKNLFTGAAAITTELEPVGSNYVAIYLIGSNGTDINAQGITNVTWQVLSTSGSCTPSFSASGFEGLGMGNCSNWVVNLKITVTNACGNTILYRTLTPPPPPPCDDNFRLANNPMKSGGEVNKIIIDPCDESALMKDASTQNKTYTVSIMNIYGNEVYSKSQKNTTFHVSNLNKGLYIVQLKSPNGKMSSKKLLVE